MNPERIFQLCKNKKVWIQTHNFPDPDAMASAFGLQELLKSKGIEAKICHEGDIDRLSSLKLLSYMETKMFPYSEIKDEMQADDLIILVDCQKKAGNVTDFIGDEQAVIDHHPTFADVSYEYADLRICGACASIIASYYNQLEIEPSETVATALLYGMKMDMLNFKRGVTQFDILMHAYLFPRINQEQMTFLESNNMDMDDLIAYGLAIRHVRVVGKVGFSYINYECPDALVAMLSDFLLSLVEVEVVIMYAKRDQGYKFSFRSENSSVHAGIFANKGLETWGNGGGHASMAGGFVPYDNVGGAEGREFYKMVQNHFCQFIEKNYPNILEDGDDVTF